MLERLDAVIFDMDGVIFDSERLCLHSWEKIAEESGLTGIREIFVKCIGTTKAETKRIMLARYGESFPYEKFAKRASKVFHEIVEERGLPVKRGAEELLKLLRDKKAPLGLASSTRLAVVEQELRDAGLYHYFDVIVGGDQLTKSKPEPDIYLMACGKMKVRPERAYAVEDSYNGIRSAFSAGMKPIMVPDMLPPDEEMREKSVLIVEDLVQLGRLFQQMNF